ncbi:MAG: glycosyltransferase family 2 protein [Bacteroidota bacterium]
MQSAQHSLAVTMTCHNRRDKTIKCLDTLYQQDYLDQIALSVFLVDDGSTDGTSEAVAAKFPEVHVIKGDGSLFWNKGMYLSFEHAQKAGPFDYYMLLNDDTFLVPDALRNLIGTHLELVKQGKGCSVVTGSTKDPETQELTYGGYRKLQGFNPFRYELVHPGEAIAECATMCGNCVLIPREVEEKVGNLDPQYVHRWGDVDYGLRALEKDCHVYAAPRFIGYCASNPNADKWRNPHMPFKERIKELHSVKGLHKEDWRAFVRRHGGPAWLIFWLSPYVKIGLTSLMSNFQSAPSSN